MKVLKMWFHMKATVKKMIYKIVFGNRFKVGKGTTWRNDFHIAIEGGNVNIGSDCFFNNGCSVCSLESVNIGDGTIFGENSHVYDHNHRFRSEEDSIKSQGYTIAPVSIGKHVWVGSNVVILKGVTIGDNSVIGAGCVVEQDIPANSIVKNGGELVVTEKDLQTNGRKKERYE